MDRSYRRSKAHIMTSEWATTLRQVAERVELGYKPVLVCGWMQGTNFIAAVRSLGGEVELVEPFHGWVLRPEWVTEWQTRALGHAPEMKVDGVVIEDFVGACVVRLDGKRYVALRTENEELPVAVYPSLILGGPDLEATLTLAARLKATQLEWLRDDIQSFGTETHVVDRGSVTEGDLVLPAEFKRSLLEYVDCFWRSAELCASLRISPTRGILLVGAPGTGKSLTVRHLLTRFAGCRRFVYMAESSGCRLDTGKSFTHMLSRINASRDAAIVVMEDIDKITQSGQITPEFLLNALDGLFEPTCPVLWIATSNDPTGLEQNLLDRPGRFDRVFVFPRPGLPERRGLIRRYSPWPVCDETIETIATQSGDLTGAHLKEVCYCAALRSVECPSKYPESLMEELVRVNKQHDQSRAYHQMLTGDRKLGFGSA